jgi:hypothetical protein
MKKQEVELIRDSSEKLIAGALEKIIAKGYHVDQLVPLSKTSFLVLKSKMTAPAKKKVTKKTQPAKEA